MAECPHFTILVEPVIQNGASESHVNRFTATCQDCGKSASVDAWQDGAQINAVRELLGEDQSHGDDVIRLTPAFKAMSPLQKWETLVLSGLIGTDEPWIEDMRQSLRDQEQALDQRRDANARATATRR